MQIYTHIAARYDPFDYYYCATYRFTIKIDVGSRTRNATSISLCGCIMLLAGGEHPARSTYNNV